MRCTGRKSSASKAVLNSAGPRATASSTFLLCLTASISLPGASVNLPQSSVLNARLQACRQVFWVPGAIESPGHGKVASRGQRTAQVVVSEQGLTKIVEG